MGQSVIHQPLPVSPPVTGIIAPFPKGGEVVLTRIDSYDIAKALAVLGMIAVNYSVILLDFFEGSSLFIDIAQILCGRAAALFVMLAGIGITLMARKPLTTGDTVLLRKYRKGILKRCVVLFIMGHLFWLYWRADILHFYALFLILGALLVTCSARILWGLNVVIILVAVFVFWLTGGDPDVSQLFFFKGKIVSNIFDLLLSGNYSTFPWLSFLLTGIWLGKKQLSGNNDSKQGRIVIAALCTFVISEKLMSIGDFYPDPSVNLMTLMLTREAFPISPLYILSAGSGAILLIIGTMKACRIPWLLNLLLPLKNVGRLSLTIYVAHIFMAYALDEMIGGVLVNEAFLLSVEWVYLASCLFFVVFANIWCRHFQYGPLEWVLRRSAASRLF